MKYLVKFVVVTFLLLVSTHTLAEQKIVVLDMKYVLNNSKAGKGAQDFLKKSPTTGVDRRIGSKFGAKVKARIVAKIQLVMDNTSLKNPRK